MGASSGHHLLTEELALFCNEQNNYKFFWVKTNLLKHRNGKHLQYSIGSPTFFEWKMRRPSKPVVLNRGASRNF